MIRTHNRKSHQESVKRAERLFSNTGIKIESQKGMSLVEIIVAVGVSTIALAALISLSIITSRTSDYASQRSQAIEIAKSALEGVRTIRDNRLVFQGTDYAVCNIGGSCTACSAWTWSPIASCPWNGASVFYLAVNDNDQLYLQHPNEGGEDDFFYDEYRVPDAQDFFQQLVIEEGPTNNGTDKTVTVNVGWYFHDKPYTVSMTTLLTNWK